MVDQGLLELDADVNRYLKEFKLENKFSKPVRVRDLLTHTGGFDQLGYGRHVQTREGVKPLGEFLSDQLVRIRIPGTVSCYDTYGITLAGYLVEQVSGLKFEDYLLTRDLTRSMLTRQHSNHELLPGYGYAFWEDRKYGISAFSHDRGVSAGRRRKSRAVASQSRRLEHAIHSKVEALNPDKDRTEA